MLPIAITCVINNASASYTGWWGGRKGGWGVEGAGGGGEQNLADLIGVGRWQGGGGGGGGEG